MKKKGFLLIVLLAVATILVPTTVEAYTIYTSTGEPSVGFPNFGTLSNSHMKLKYGFLGAAVYDAAQRRWKLCEMITNTRHKVKGYVNQLNNNMALAVGLYDVAIYDYYLHKWVVYVNGHPDDTTYNLSSNFILTSNYAKVRLLRQSYLVYKFKSGRWTEKH